MHRDVRLLTMKLPRIRLPTSPRNRGALLVLVGLQMVVTGSIMLQRHHAIASQPANAKDKKSTR